MTQLDNNFESLRQFKCFMIEYVSLFRKWLACFDEKIEPEDENLFTTLIEILETGAKNKEEL